METVKNKNILIIGATGGIGNKTARLLASSGANLFMAARNKEKLETLAGETGFDKNKTLALDISRPEAIAVLKDNYFSQYPTIDILIQIII